MFLGVVVKPLSFKLLLGVFCNDSMLLVNKVWLLVLTGKREESLNKYNSALTELPPSK